jgi:hypothetical protein
VDFSEAAVQTLVSGDQSPTVYAAMGRQRHGRSIAQLEVRDDPSPPPADAPVAEPMAHQLVSAEGTRNPFGRRPHPGSRIHLTCSQPAYRKTVAKRNLGTAVGRATLALDENRREIS